MATVGARPKRGEDISWNPEIAYATGLLATDGCLSIDGRHIELTSKDEEQLKNFMYCIDKDVVIRTKTSGFTGKPVAHIQFSDVTLYRFLIKIGMTPRKTMTLGALLVPDDFFFDFLRGHHDGDGSFSSYYDPRWKSSFMFYLSFTSASDAHLLWIRQVVQRLTGAQGHLVRSATSTLIQLRYAKRESLLLLEQMYKNPKAICLSRKRLKISKALRIVGQSLPGFKSSQVVPR